MKFNLFKHTGRVMKTIYIFSMLIMGSATVLVIRAKRIDVTTPTFAIVFSLTFFMISLCAYTYIRVTGKYDGTIEFTEDEIICREKDRNVIMKWRDVESVSLYPGHLFLPTHRVVYFASRGLKAARYGRPNRVSEDFIWSEYNDEMIDEIKKYWRRRIKNEDRYMKYKNRRSKWSK